MKRLELPFLLVACLLITACTPSSMPEPTVTPSLAPTLTGTPLPTNTSTPMPTPTVAPSPTPTPTPQPITAANVTQLQHVMTLGNGAVDAFAWSPDGNQLAIVTSQGLWLYDGNDYSEINHWTIESPQILIDYSPDGTLVATAGTDGVIRLWEVETGEETLRIQSPQAYITALAFSPDESTLASSSRGLEVDTYETAPGTPNATVEIWDVSSGELIRTMETRTISISSLLYTPDSKTLISGGRTASFDPGFFGPSSTGYVEVWDLDTGSVTAAWVHGKDISRMALISDGTTLITIGEDDPNVKFWTLANGVVEDFRAYSATWIAHTSDVAVSPDGTELITTGSAFTGIGRYTTEMYNWSLPNREKVVEFEGVGYDVRFHPDGSRIAGNVNSTLRIWDSRTGQMLHTFEEYDGWSIEQILENPEFLNGSLAISPDNEMLAAAWGGSVALWNLGEHTLIPVPSDFQTGTLGSDTNDELGYSADGSLLITGYLHGIQFWDTESLTLADELSIDDGYHMVSVVISRDGTSLAAYWRTIVPSADRYTLLWDITQRYDPAQFYFPEGYGVVALGEGGHIIAVRRTSVSGSRIQFFEFVEDWQRWNFPYYDLRIDELEVDGDGYFTRGDISSMAFSPDGVRAITCGAEDATVRLWELESGEESATVRLGEPGRVVFDEGWYPPENKCNDIVYSPDGSLIALATLGGAVRLYNPILDNELVILDEPEHPVAAVTFSRDGTLLAAASVDGLIWIWQVLDD